MRKVIKLLKRIFSWPLPPKCDHKWKTIYSVSSGDLWATSLSRCELCGYEVKVG